MYSPEQQSKERRDRTIRFTSLQCCDRRCLRSREPAVVRFLLSTDARLEAETIASIHTVTEVAQHLARIVTPSYYVRSQT